MTSTEPRATLVLPTYNERENLPALVAAIQALELPIHIIVVDDNSPDGTGALADALAARSAQVSVIHRAGKLGLGTAYVAGFRQALADGAEAILTMDADFSHHPRYLPAMLEASRSYDLVIGSRYVRGGGVENWGPERKLLSWGANRLAHLIVGLHARDCTAGFRCYRRRVLETVDPATIRADGYSYLVEMLYRVQEQGFSVGEIPIIFADRRLGQSKISRSEILKAGRTVARLAGRRLRRAGRRLRASLAAGPVSWLI
ncbi:MAG: Undecaprenyl-phosphate mannosyltransferase [Chloroflexi bacterium ADurb.Bin325]|nr:MAG: Undecaprenyl-phosphate mannosyltransferase [Chloroflexi bacterium ADurb.Bin325]